MASVTGDERLVVLLEARVRDFETNLKKAGGTARREFGGMRRDSRSATRQMETDMVRASSRINSALATTSTRIGAFRTNLLTLGRSVGGIFAGALALKGAQSFIDSSIKITNALKATGLEGKALDAVYGDLYASAQRNSAPLESLVKLYSSVALNMKELNTNSSELVGFTDTIAMALRAGGTSASEASGALMQLSQTLGGGVVRAEEFNSILEGAPVIAQAAAAGIREAGGSVAELRKLKRAQSSRMHRPLSIRTCARGRLTMLVMTPPRSTGGAFRARRGSPEAGQSPRAGRPRKPLSRGPRQR